MTRVLKYAATVDAVPKANAHRLLNLALDRHFIVGRESVSNLEPFEVGVGTPTTLTAPARMSRVPIERKCQEWVVEASRRRWVPFCQYGVICVSNPNLHVDGEQIQCAVLSLRYFVCIKTWKDNAKDARRGLQTCLQTIEACDELDDVLVRDVVVIVGIVEAMLWMMV